MVVSMEPSTVAVHRCRFVEYTPAAITALAFPPPPLPLISEKAAAKAKAPAKDTSLKCDILAIGRANGNIEIAEWTPHEGELQAPQAWTVRKTLHGPHPSKVDSLAFALRHTLGENAPVSASDLRLFSSGGGGELLEWDIEASVVRRTLNSQGGAIWSFAVNPSSTRLALGCEDGIVRIISLEHDTLEHFRRFDRSKSRILSIAWGAPTAPTKTTTDDPEQSDDEDEEWTDEWIVTGGSDSAVSKWNFRTGRIVQRMATDKVRGERTLVWSVGVLGDGTIVSGDSMGIVKFWDPRTHTQMHSFRAHGADVLCLTISHDGTAIYSSGIDQKITQFALVHPPTPNASTSSRPHWIQTTSRRVHSHDVRALAIWPPYLPLAPAHRRHLHSPLAPDVAPILVSGGLDASVAFTPAALARATVRKLVNPLATSVAATFEDGYPRRLAYASGAAGTSALCVARAARVLVLASGTTVSLWRITQRKNSLSEVDDVEVKSRDKQDGWDKLVEMDLNIRTHITAAAISDDAKWLVVSDAYESKLFALESTPSGGIKPRRIRNFSTVFHDALNSESASSSSDERLTASMAFAFAPDCRKLTMATVRADILVVDLGDGKASPRVLRRFTHHRLRGVGARVVRGLPLPAGARAQNQKGNVEKKGSGEDEESEEGDEDGEEERVSVTRMAVSADGQWLATTDDRCRTHVFSLDALRHHSVLPSTPTPVRALVFDGTQPHLLVLCTASHLVQTYDCEARTYPPWSRWLSAALPKRFTHLHDGIVGAASDPGAEAVGPRNVLFWGATWICCVTLDAPPGYGDFNRKRRRDGRKNHKGQPNGVVTVGGDEDGQQNFKLITHYRPILFADYIGQGELVVVERPLVDVLATLPPPYFKAKYGAS